MFFCLFLDVVVVVSFSRISKIFPLSFVLKVCLFAKNNRSDSKQEEYIKSFFSKTNFQSS